MSSSPSPFQRRVFAILSIVYGGLVLGFVPWADRPLAVTPVVVGVYGIGILFADLCTAAMLVRMFATSRRRPALLVLISGYLFSAGLVLAYTLSFHGAVGPGRWFGNESTAAVVFLALRLGSALLAVAAVEVESRVNPTEWDLSKRHLLLAFVITTLSCALIAALAANTNVAFTLGDHFTRTSQAVSYGAIAICLVGVYLIWRRRLHDSLYLWLALILVASAADLILSTAAGGRFTVGWYVARCSSVVSSYLLLTFLLGELASDDRSQDLIAITVRYAAAITIAAAAIVLRWFLHPWLKWDLQYATLFGAIAVAVWMGGWGPALVASIVGLVGTTLLVGGVESVTAATSLSSMIGLAVYAASSVLIIGLGETMRKARDDYRRSQEMYKDVALELKQRAADLQRADGIKSLFLATLSHELRNPLAPLRNGLAIIKLRVPDGPTDVYAMMERQLKQVTRLIDDLLDVSRLDRGKMELHRERVPVESFVNAAIETARPNIEGKSHELVVRYAPRSFHVDGDPARLAQVISNLLNNASKYTPESGRIELSMRAEGPTAVISIRDNGIGIPAADLGRIFDTFVQLDASKTQAAAGLGLGLALARSLVALHGGHIKVRSEGVGKGSEFDVHLPLVAAPASSSSEVSTAQLAQPSRRVLIADDNLDAANSLAALLESNGHSVRVCFDGASAYESAAQWVPEVAFLDLNMPPPDGIELARMLRKQPWGKNMKLVALTGMGQPADIARTRAAGFDEHLTKPASTPELLKAVCATPRFLGTNVVAFRAAE